MGRGYCERCYTNLRYHETIERQHANRKAARLRNDDYEKRRPKVLAWRADHKEHTRAYNREYARKQSKWQVGTEVWFWYDARDWIKAKAIRNAKGQMQSVKPKSEPVWAKGRIVGRAEDGKSVVVKSHGRGKLIFGVRRLKLLSFDSKPPVGEEKDSRPLVRTELGPARIVRTYVLDGLAAADVELESNGQVIGPLKLEVRRAS